MAEQILDTAVDVLELTDVEIYLFDRSDNTVRSVGRRRRGPKRVDRPGREYSVGCVRAGQRCRSSPRREHRPRGGAGHGGREAALPPARRPRRVLHRTAPQHARQNTRVVDLLAASAEAALARVDRETTLREREAERRGQNRELRRLSMSMPSSAG